MLSSVRILMAAAALSIPLAACTDGTPLPTAPSAPVFDDTDPSPSPRPMFRRTEALVAETGNIEAACRAEFGASSTVADWSEIVAFHRDRGSLAELFDMTGLHTYRSSAMVTSNGRRWWSGTRHYFVERHDGVIPSGWLVHDHLNSHELDLGSWSGFERTVMCSVQS